MKTLAAALGGKAATIMPPADAERLSGYKVGGISPFGQTRLRHVVLDSAPLEHDRVFVNAGQRGLQVELDPHDPARLLGAVIAPIRAAAKPGKRITGRARSAVRGS